MGRRLFFPLPPPLVTPFPLNPDKRRKERHDTRNDKKGLHDLDTVDQRLGKAHPRRAERTSARYKRQCQIGSCVYGQADCEGEARTVVIREDGKYRRGYALYHHVNRNGQGN